jgi:putative transcriptional regulator
MINLHPTQQQLVSFVEGNCAPAMALVIAAHTDMCSKCANHVAVIQEHLASSEIDEAKEQEHCDFGSMMARITQLPVAEGISVPAAEKTIELDGRQFNLPRSLRRFVDNTGNWSHLLGNLYQAPVDLGPIGKANFIYMQKGGRVPEHTHRGNELTLVIDGEFSDGISHYDTGDFIVMNQSNTHAPFSDANEGCLVFSIVDAPLHFTSGVARLLNPFSHLFF